MRFLYRFARTTLVAKKKPLSKDQRHRRRIHRNRDWLKAVGISKMQVKHAKGVVIGGEYMIRTELGLVTVDEARNPKTVGPQEILERAAKIRESWDKKTKKVRKEIICPE
jgi:hypothetical protein